MTTIQLTLPDDLAKKATEAGLLSAEAIQEMLREQLLRRAGESLQAIRRRMPNEELTPEIEQEIVEAVRWTPDFGRPDKVEPPGLEAPYQEDDDAGQATCVWGSV
jgi:hypothetical protein